MIYDQSGTDPEARAATLVYGYLGRAYMLSPRDRRLLNIADAIWGVATIAAVMCARFELLGIAAVLETAAGILVLRLAIITIYLRAMHVPPSDMALWERARLAYFTLRGYVVGGLRTMSIVFGLCLVVLTVVLAVEGDLLSNWGLLIISVGLLVLFVAAVIADVLVHRWYARRARDGDRT